MNNNPYNPSITSVILGHVSDISEGSRRIGRKFGRFFQKYGGWVVLAGTSTATSIAGHAIGQKYGHPELGAIIGGVAPTAAGAALLAGKNVASKVMGCVSDKIYSRKFRKRLERQEAALRAKEVEKWSLNRNFLR